MTDTKRYRAFEEARPSGFAPPASAEQLQQIRELGGHPPDGLSRSQAQAAIRALRDRRRGKAGR